MQKVWDTRQIAPHRRAEFWRGAVCEAFLSMTPRIACAADFAATLEHLPVANLALNRVRAPSHGVARTSLDLARSGPAVLFVNLPLQGRGVVIQHGRQHCGTAGQLMLIDATEPYRIELPDGGALLSLAVPRATLQRAVPAVADHCARALPDSPAVRLLQSQMRVLADHPEPLPPSQAGVIGDVLMSLIAVVCAPGAAPRSAPALLQRLRSLIDSHLDDPDFGPAQAAALACVSLRSVHAAFAREGSSFAREQLEKRLQRAHERLCLPPSCTPVAEIARACGFRAPTHFARRFRERFGCSPRQARSGGG